MLSGTKIDKLLIFFTLTTLITYVSFVTRLSVAYLFLISRRHVLRQTTSLFASIMQPNHGKLFGQYTADIADLILKDQSLMTKASQSNPSPQVLNPF